MMRCSILLVALGLAASGCKDKPAVIAELTNADGPIERQDNTELWKLAPVGTEYFIGDAARTAAAGAQLKLLGTATIAMQPHTVLRFGVHRDAGRISVEVGAIDLTGTGKYKLDVGDLNLSRDGSVRITALGKGRSALELTIGEGQVVKDGRALDLAIGRPVELIDVTVSSSGAKPPSDAAVASEVDAGVEPASEAMIEVTGDRAETQAPGASDWKKLPAGAGTLAKRTKLRLGAGTTAKLTAKGTTVELNPGAKATLADDLVIAIESGSARTSGTGSVLIPGGSVEVKAAAAMPALARLNIGRSQSTVSVMRGTAKLSAAVGAALDMNRGESATLTRTGTIHVLEAIPNSFDLRVPVGETLVVHDPRPPTSIQFQFLGNCAQGGVIEMDRDPRFRTARLSAGKDNANVLVASGSWEYRLRCTVGNDDGPPVASGRIVVLRDDGRRPLPAIAATNEVFTDGRTTTISYQSAIPNLVVHYEGTGSSFVLHLATSGKEQTFTSKSPRITVPGSTLREGTYTYWIDHDGVQHEKKSTFKIDFDNTAPQVYIESPPNGQPFTDNIEVKVSALAGWTAQINGVPLAMDNRRRFVATVGPPSAGKALAIRLSHPHLGTHYYLRRGR
jgi:hypothetical protein